jgi:hypothetical protein
MKKQRLFLIITLLLIIIKSASQDIKITSPKLEFDGKQLQISYDVINSNQSDQLYVWVEISKKNGELIRMKNLSGDVGDIKGGNNKKISWVPANDSIFLNEMVSVEVKAEKYNKSFKKGSMMLLSTAFPGLGQTKISKGKPWWLTGVAAYGALAGGFITHQSYVKTYDSYRTEEDPKTRVDLNAKAQKQMNMSTALYLSGAALWAANMIWVAVIPNKYQPLQHVKLSLNASAGPENGATLLSMKLNF